MTYSTLSVRAYGNTHPRPIRRKPRLRGRTQRHDWHQELSRTFPGFVLPALSLDTSLTPALQLSQKNVARRCRNLQLTASIAETSAQFVPGVSLNTQSGVNLDVSGSAGESYIADIL